MQSSKWNAMSLLMDDKTKQAEVLRTAIDEADAIVIGIGAGMSASDGFTYVGERFTENFPDFIENIASLICCKRVYILMAVGKNIGHLRVVLLH